MVHLYISIREQEARWYFADDNGTFSNPVSDQKSHTIFEGITEGDWGEWCMCPLVGKRRERLYIEELKVRWEDCKTWRSFPAIF